MKTKEPVLFKIALIILFSFFIFFIRFQFIQRAGNMPINDGGMFYTMTRELIQNGFKLPQFTQYNQMDIPYSYPPFAFYTAGFISEFLHIDLIKVETCIPLFFNLLAIPFFFLLAKEVLDTSERAIIATAAFAFSICSFEWLIMGGGIARSPAYTFLILTLWLLISGIKRKKWLRICLTGLFYGITFGFHIETGYTTTLLILLTILFFARNKFGVVSFFLMHLIAAVVYGPVFLTSIKMNGITPFLNAFQSGYFDIGIIFTKLLAFDFFGLKPILNIAGVLAFLGAVMQARKRNFFLVTWIVVICFLVPRSVERFALIPGAILFSYAVFEIFVKRLPAKEYLFKQDFLNSHNIVAFVFSLTVIFSVLAANISNSSVTKSLSQADQTAFDWINTHIPDDQQFIVIPSNAWYDDVVSEWFPALTRQSSYFTVQGLEWMGTFYEKQDEQVQFFKDTLNLGIETALSKLDIPGNYVYCSMNQADTVLLQCPESIDGYRIIYNQDDVTIYEKETVKASDLSPISALDSAKLTAALF